MQTDDRDEHALKILDEGRANPKLIRDETGLDKGDVNTVLVRLGRAGLVRQVTRGLYEITADGREEIGVEPVDEAELRERLQDALEARDDAQQRADELEADLEDCREQLEAAREGSVDTAAIRRAVDDLEAACERGDGGAVQDAIGRLREAIGDA